MAENLVNVYMPISREEAKEMGYKSSDIVIRRIGIKNVTCIKTQATREFAEEYEKMLDAEARAELREKRCLVPDGKGSLKRCPEGNACKECTRRFEEHFCTNKPLSYEQITQGEDQTIDIADKSEMEEGILAQVVLEDLLQHLSTFEGKHYAKILRMLYNQCGTKEIADELGMPWSTAKDAIQKVKKLSKEYMEL